MVKRASGESQRGVSSGVKAADDLFGVQSIIETKDRLTIRIAGTELQLIESRACREVAERIASQRGWTTRGAQREQAYRVAGESIREFVFLDQ